MPFNYQKLTDYFGIPVYPNEVISLERYKQYFEDILFFDVGAYRGLWSLIALLNGAKFAIGFEPQPIEDMVRNLSQFAGKYRCINAFVTDEENLHKDDNFRITIDRFVKKERYNQLGFMKIDVEGEEMEVLRGAEQTIRKFKPYLMIESHDYRHPGRKEEIQLLLGDWGYKDPEIVNHTEGVSEIYHLFYTD